MAVDALCGVALSAGAAFLFYRSAWGLLLAVPFVPLYVKSSMESRKKKEKSRLQQQFLSGMQMVSGSLAAGYSIENAWRRAEGEIQDLYGKDAIFSKKLHRMNRRLAVNEPLEQILTDFAAESDVEEIWHFAEVFSYAKRSGGSLSELIRSLTARMQQRAEVLNEIEAAVAARQMEQKVMNAMLPGILFFVTISSPSYVQALYHNFVGVCAMSVCLAGYLICMYWSAKIMDIPL